MSRILVVEDEQHLADGLRFNLEAEGYQVAVALRREKPRWNCWRLPPEPGPDPICWCSTLCFGQDASP